MSHLLPASDATYDLGSSTRRWRDGYLSGNLTLSSLTAGSILFAGSGGLISQDNANLFWDNVNKRLGIGTTAPTAVLDVRGISKLAYASSSQNIHIGETVDNWYGLNLLNIRVGDPGVPPTRTLGLYGNKVAIYATDFVVPSGNVGIGTTSPAEKLHVIGNVRIDDAYKLLWSDVCVSEDTEILTLDGWRKYYEVSEGDLVLTLNTEKDRLEYQVVKRVFVQPYKGKMYRIANKLRGVDMLVSPNHRVLVVRGEGKLKKKKYEFLKPTELPYRFRIPVAGKFEGVKSVSKPWLKVLGWVITEGTKERKSETSILITQSEANLEHLEDIRSALWEANIKYSDWKSTKRGYKPTHYLHLDVNEAKKIWEALDGNIHQLPRRYLNLRRECLEVLRDTLIAGDGHIQHYKTRLGRGGRVKPHSFTSIRRELADAFQELCLKTGWSATVREIPPRASKHHTQYTVYIAVRDSRLLKRDDVSEVEYDGIIWCVETENGTFVARRNGKPFITGNSLYRVAADVLKTDDSLDALALRIGGSEVITSGRVLQNVSSLNQHLTPSLDNTYDLGSASVRFRYVYCMGVDVGDVRLRNGMTISEKDGKLTIKNPEGEVVLTIEEDGGIIVGA